MTINKITNIQGNNVYVNGNNVLEHAGIRNTEDILNRKLEKDDFSFTIVGVTDKTSPSIYMDKSLYINLLNSQENISSYSLFSSTTINELTHELLDYKLYGDDITLVKGRYPENDYEVIVNVSNKSEMKLNKEIDEKVNEENLTVVGYYESKTNRQDYFVSENTVKYSLIENCNQFVIYTENKQEVINNFKNNYGLRIIDTYESDRKDYLSEKEDEIISTIIFSTIVLAVSLIEIFLMIRSSFLSRIKEIGVLRAIGIKISDIYKMFIGEILAITTVSGMPGIILMVYILKTMLKATYFDGMFMMNGKIIGLSVLIIYGFNLLVGLLPLYWVVSETPAKIFARHDIE